MASIPTRKYQNIAHARDALAITVRIHQSRTGSLHVERDAFLQPVVPHHCQPAQKGRNWLEETIGHG
jgi:hypothetical protein